jgi:hypothetical protein
MKQILGRILLALAVLLTGLLAGGAIFLTVQAVPADETGLAALTSGEGVVFDDGRWLTFTPVNTPSNTGFIFYPGGLVDAEAYAPFAREIAKAGYVTVLVPMPFNMAFFNFSEAEDVMAAYPNIEKWVIGGHSLGGAMAAQYVSNDPNAVQGLVLWGSYPPENIDLSALELDVVSIYGTLDGLVSPEELATSREQLPPNSEFVGLEGGNHAQFGWYGPQNGDNPATLPHSEQQAQTIAATLKVLAAVSGE